MKITTILQPEALISELSSQDKQGLLKELSQAIAGVEPRVSPQEVYKVLREREKLGSTGIGSGVAIPHGKMEKLENIVACFGRSREGIEFESQDGEPTHLFFGLVAPEDSAGLHLQALAKLSRMLKNPAFRQKLLEASNAHALYQVIAAEDEKS